ncbi:helix-turn-helix domain-containing protein [Haloarcula sp. S1CR25-12]|uniref:Helix-turn-helix domain-containing protein n=1 Tax=Haloarcula saliterrae TaxID=2950534 RepID=A0ABU2F993_9EURY|nr:helix-turn-helix domain-containing protein [Haloarcula sp. S1CR25-12]MDS0258824.1 helix-turn-helix domain-containing protein [Haloarcula sp. S1CR25-12]
MTASAEAGSGPSGSADSGNAALTETTTADLLDLLDDAHAREILVALVGEPKSARDIVSACSCSRPTVYRRLERLNDAGLVDSSMQYDEDGHHRKLFRRRLDSVAVELSDGGWSVRVDTVGR